MEDLAHTASIKFKSALKNRSVYVLIKLRGSKIKCVGHKALARHKISINDVIRRADILQYDLAGRPPILMYLARSRGPGSWKFSVGICAATIIRDAGLILGVNRY